MSGANNYPTITQYGNNVSKSNHNHRDVNFKAPYDNDEYGRVSGFQKLIYCVTGNEDYRSELIRRGKYRESSINSVSAIDRMSRIV